MLLKKIKRGVGNITSAQRKCFTPTVKMLTFGGAAILNFSSEREEGKEGREKTERGRKDREEKTRRKDMEKTGREKKEGRRR